ncbi:e3 ubiquitin-protein ligase siah2 [Holotrichia oblita]|uniref:E3 ubiquitin-protein ligase siah2 n=1 Tax=Holotrichia oblita TaxID=644536 RepID=A0ACB9SI44_HOLOL|nr:e3 ubiquitin-protein ligase siah2 [Holotrichia oblita]
MPYNTERLGLGIEENPGTNESGRTRARCGGVGEGDETKDVRARFRLADVNKVFARMECPVCFLSFKPPIYQCVNGHSFCSDCTDKLKKCPTCSYAMSQTRNYTLEAIVDEMLRKPCPNSTQGCSQRLFPEELEEHRRVCDNRIYTCPMNSIGICEWKGQRDFGLHQHVKEKHSWNTSQKFYTAWTITTPQYPMSFHYLHGKLFYFYRLLKNEVLYWVVRFIGPQQEAKKYYYIVTVSRKKFEQKLIIRQTCFDDCLDPDELIEGGLCVGVPVKALNDYMVKNEREKKHKILPILPMISTSISTSIGDSSDLENGINEIRSIEVEETDEESKSDLPLI